MAFKDKPRPDSGPERGLWGFVWGTLAVNALNEP